MPQGYQNPQPQSLAFDSILSYDLGTDHGDGTFDVQWSLYGGDSISAGTEIIFLSTTNGTGGKKRFELSSSTEGSATIERCREGIFSLSVPNYQNLNGQHMFGTWTVKFDPAPTNGATIIDVLSIIW